MSVIKDLICTEEDGTLSFGNYELAEKAKRSDYEHEGDLYKVNGMFVYESVPGTAVHHFHSTANGVSFEVEGREDAQIILGLEEDAEYKIYIDDVNAGTMTTQLGGKLVLSVEIGAVDEVPVKVVKL